MSDELPPLWALDMAATMTGWRDWAAVTTLNSAIIDAVTAHARTLAKYEKRPVDEAELKRRKDAREAAMYSAAIIDDDEDNWTHEERFAAYCALCWRDQVIPTLMEEWSDK